MYCHYHLPIVTFLSVSIALSTGQQSDFDDRTCGRQLVQLEGLIKGGFTTRPGEWPWHVAIFHRTEPGSEEFEYQCGGSLVHRYLVITAAHCVSLRSSRKHKSTDDVLNKAGRYDISLDQEEHGRHHKVAQIVTPEDYRPRTYENDIAIVRLAVPVILTQYLCAAGLLVETGRRNSASACVS